MRGEGEGIRYLDNFYRICLGYGRIFEASREMGKVGGSGWNCGYFALFTGVPNILSVS